MHLGPAARGFLALLLSAPALQGNNDLKNTDTSSTVCAVRRSTLNISCDYEYPDNGQNSNTTETLWFTKPDRNTLIDIRNDANYGGRVEYSCGDMRCTGSKCHRTCALKIKDLGESDSAEYEFKFRRDQSAEEYSCYPGLNLSVTDLQLKLVFLDSNQPNVVDLECHSTCGIPNPSYKWFRNGQHDGQGRYYKGIINSQDSYSCAVEGYEHLQTPSVYAPKNLSVTMSPSGGIEEGSSVTLSCSSDANPAATYSWFRNNQRLPWRPSEPYTFTSVRIEDRGTYRCKAENTFGHQNSSALFINVQYAPKTPSMTVSPSGEIEEGSSVTLSCSTDANPEAKYSWFKEHEDSAVESGQNYSITNITSEHRGNYFCQARNSVGSRNSTLLFVNVTDSSSSSTSSPPSSSSTLITAAAVGTVAVALLLLVFLWLRRRACGKAHGNGGRPHTTGESHHSAVYSNVSTLTDHLDSVVRREPIEEQDELQYAAVHFSSRLAGRHVQSDQTEQALYSVLNLNKPNAVPEDRDQTKTGEASELYSLVRKHPRV